MKSLSFHIALLLQLYGEHQANFRHWDHYQQQNGSHPLRAQVPPKGLLSMMATDKPLLLHLFATVNPAVPVLITMRSKPWCVI